MKKSILILALCFVMLFAVAAVSAQEAEVPAEEPVAEEAVAEEATLKMTAWLKSRPTKMPMQPVMKLPSCSNPFSTKII